MNRSLRILVASLILEFASIAGAQAQADLVVLDDKPVPTIDAGGPSATVTSLAFSPDGETLFAAGLDKVVRVFTLQKDRFVLKAAFRVPIGPGNSGSINAIALSPDGAWIAMAGRSPIRGEAGFRAGGFIEDAEALTAEQNQDAGIIYLASTANPAGGKVLRGHRGEVRTLAFLPPHKDKAPLLVSAATERDRNRRFGGMRLWDVVEGKLVASTDDLPARIIRPGLAAWHTGPKANEVRVVAAWPEDRPQKQSRDDLAKNPDYLYVWDPSAVAKPRYSKADHFTQTAVLVRQDPDGGARVLAGGFDLASSGRLSVWQIGGPAAEAKLQFDLPFPARNGVQFLPVGLTLFSDQGGAAPNSAAVVLQPTGTADFRLALIELPTSKIVADIPLKGSDRSQLPTVAARGSFVAVACARDHAIRLYTVADLRAGKTEPKATFANDGLAPKQVAFTDKGTRLWFGEDENAKPLSAGFRFDLEKRKLDVNEQANLAIDAPDVKEWKIDIVADKQGVTVQQGNRKAVTVRLRGQTDVVTKVAVRPAAHGIPDLLAIAYTERDANRTLIMLCTAADGRPVRLLTGHLQDVRDLAFSAAKPLLASVADDQTVSIWSLADINNTYGQAPGFWAEDRAKQGIVVRRVDPGSGAANAKLAVGDVIEKITVAGGEAKPVKDTASLYLAFSVRKPGETIEVTVAGKGVLKMPVERGVDERKPLFSFLMLRNAKLPEWIGWSPAGPYDCSGPTAEARLGWHTNTGDKAAPVSYVAARVHRKDYYREGILRYLVDEADLGRALKKWHDDHPEVPKEAMLRPIPPEGAQPGLGVYDYQIRQGLKSLQVVVDDDYPLDDKHILRWHITRVDGGIVQGKDAEKTQVAKRDGKTWTADLTGIEWRRGEYRLRLGLFANANGPDLAWQTVKIRYQPPAPMLALKHNGKLLESTEQTPLMVMDERLKVQIEPDALQGQKVDVVFQQWVNGLQRSDPPKASKDIVAAPFAQEFKLAEGLNRFAVRVVNTGALSNHEDDEAAAAEFWVSYKAPKEALPRFNTLRLEPEPETKRIDGKDVWVVTQPTTRLIGTIEAEGILTQASVSAGDEPKSVLPKKEDKTAAFTIDLPVLKAGNIVPIKLRAKTKISDESVSERWVVFHPPLPTVSIDPLESPDVQSERIAISGKFEAATDDNFKLRFRVMSANGKVNTFDPVIDRRAGTWKVDITLLPGVNAVETLVSNEWRDELPVGGTLNLNYRRPPRIAAFPEMIKAVETTKVKLSLTVTGPIGRPLTAIEVDGKSVRFDLGQPETQDGRWIWKLELPEVFVNDGERNLDKVSIKALNDEGTSQAVIVRIVHEMIPRPPVARLINPTSPETARRPEYPVTFRIESEKPLERVEIVRDGAVLFKADLTKVEREGKMHVLQQEGMVMLRNGTNTLEVIAVNADGRSPRAGAEGVVSFNEPPVLVFTDKIELRSETNEVEQVLEPKYRANGDVVFEPAKRSLVWLVGRVRWSDPKAPALDDRNLEVLVRVGDCRQFPVALGQRGAGVESNVRPFRVPLVLIGEKNRIQIELPNVAVETSTGREFDLACTNPTRTQRLHLLIVGVNVKEANELKKRVLDSLDVDEKGRPLGVRGEFSKKPPFQQCILHRVLAGEVDRSTFVGQLAEINKEIERLRVTTGWLNDVILIYYQGEDEVVPERHQRFLKTSRNYTFRSSPIQTFAIACHNLPKLPGAQLLLLNVAGLPDRRLAGDDWGGQPGTGFMRYAFQDAQKARDPNPVLLGMLREATRSRSSLGEVVQHVNDLIDRNEKKDVSPLRVVLDQDQKNRRISEFPRR